MKISYCAICDPVIICTVGPMEVVLSHTVGAEVHEDIDIVVVAETPKLDGESNDAYLVRLIGLYSDVLI